MAFCLGIEMGESELGLKLLEMIERCGDDFSDVDSRWELGYQ